MDSDDDDAMAGLRADAADVLADNQADAPQAPQTEGPPPPQAPAASASPPASETPTNDCEFNFIGGAGVGGPYLDSFKRAFERAGIQHVNVPNEGGTPRDPQGDAPLYRVLSDVAAIPGNNDLAFAKSLVDSPAIKAAAEHSRALGDEQYNLGGYSYGAAAQAANAYAIAQNGGKVDNLVLLGAPINQDLYDAVKQHPNIKNVITLDLGAHGDPIHAGMSDLDFVKAVPTLIGQVSDPAGVGHFYYSKGGSVGDARRGQLAQTLVDDGLR
ncbi:MAG TPA: hypothetical protein VHW05_14490 [Phenylobacterium sp.]|jgi:hypothetical protein|nr:hypothetical protein [Phenylobacterium sp.]